MKTHAHVRHVERPSVTYVRRTQRPRTIYADIATMIPDGMHGIEETYHNDGWRAGRPITVYADVATMIPDGMHGAPPVDNSLTLASTVRRLIAAGVTPEKAGVMVHRAHGRVQRRRAVRASYGLSGLGDVAADATTWITYGNDIVSRSKTGNVGAEAMKAAQNINTFLGHRGDELEASSPATLDALGQMTDLLTKIASGQVKYDSAAGAFLDELGNAVRGEVLVGVQAVLDTPKKVVRYLGDEVVKPALQIVPWYVWLAGAAAGAAVAGKSLKLW